MLFYLNGKYCHLLEQRFSIIFYRYAKTEKSHLWLRHTWLSDRMLKLKGWCVNCVCGIVQNCSLVDWALSAWIKSSRFNFWSGHIFIQMKNFQCIEVIHWFLQRFIGRIEYKANSFMAIISLFLFDKCYINLWICTLLEIHYIANFILQNIFTKQ